MLGDFNAKRGMDVPRLINVDRRGHICFDQPPAKGGGSGILAYCFCFGLPDGLSSITPPAETKNETRSIAVCGDAVRAQCSGARVTNAFFDTFNFTVSARLLDRESYTSHSCFTSVMTNGVPWPFLCSGVFSSAFIHLFSRAFLSLAFSFYGSHTIYFDALRLRVSRVST